MHPDPSAVAVGFIQPRGFRIDPTSGVLWLGLGEPSEVPARAGVGVWVCGIVSGENEKNRKKSKNTHLFGGFNGKPQGKPRSAQFFFFF